jgi:hypothetical protein
MSNDRPKVATGSRIITFLDNVIVQILRQDDLEGINIDFRKISSDVRLTTP